MFRGGVVVSTDPPKQIGKGVFMPVEAAGDKYRCNVCGNVVVVEEAGGGTLVCCDEDMEMVAG